MLFTCRHKARLYYRLQKWNLNRNLGPQVNKHFKVWMWIVRAWRLEDVVLYGKVGPPSSPDNQ